MRSHSKKTLLLLATAAALASTGTAYGEVVMDATAFVAKFCAVAGTPTHPVPPATLLKENTLVQGGSEAL